MSFLPYVTVFLLYLLLVHNPDTLLSNLHVYFLNFLPVFPLPRPKTDAKILNSVVSATCFCDTISILTRYHCITNHPEDSTVQQRLAFPHDFAVLVGLSWGIPSPCTWLQLKYGDCGECLLPGRLHPRLSKLVLAVSGPQARPRFSHGCASSGLQNMNLLGSNPPWL